MATQDEENGTPTTQQASVPPPGPPLLEQVAGIGSGGAVGSSVAAVSATNTVSGGISSTAVHTTPSMNRR